MKLPNSFAPTIGCRRSGKAPSGGEDSARSWNPSSRCKATPTTMLLSEPSSSPSVNNNALGSDVHSSGYSTPWQIYSKQFFLLHSEWQCQGAPQQRTPAFSSSETCDQQFLDKDGYTAMDSKPSQLLGSCDVSRVVPTV